MFIGKVHTVEIPSHPIQILNAERIRLSAITERGEMIMGKTVPPSKDTVRKLHEVVVAISLLSDFEKTIS